MMRISYAQKQEDVILSRLLKGVAKGFYVDVGANDPVSLSVTKSFYDRGWRGINIEPQPSLWDRLRQDRPEDTNLNLGVARAAGSRTFYEIPAQAVLSTFSAADADRHRASGFEIIERPVKTATLAKICEEHVGQRVIDFLSIDVEGFEREVLEGGDWARWRPRVAMIEATRPLTTAPTHEQWEPFLLQAGYLLAWFDGQNRYYVRAEDRALLQDFRGEVLPEDADVPFAYHAAAYHNMRGGLEDYAQSLEDRLMAMHGLPESLAFVQRELEEALNMYRDENRRLEQAKAAIVVLEAELSAYRALPPRVLEIAKGLHRAAEKHPRVSSLARHVLKHSKMILTGGSRSPSPAPSPSDVV